MVLQYVRAHGRVTRREAAELRGLSLDQARRLLRRLTQENKLCLHGPPMRRDAHYTVPD